MHADKHNSHLTMKEYFRCFVGLERKAELIFFISLCPQLSGNKIINVFLKNIQIWHFNQMFTMNQP